MEFSEYFKSIVDQDPNEIVICDLDHRIIYMNPSARSIYSKRGGITLLGKSLLDCHNAASKERIIKVLDWFKADQKNNRVHSFYHEKKNKDVYIVALRNGQNELIGYYEQHQYRNRDMDPLYDFT